MDKESEVQEEELDFECWHRFNGVSVEIRVEDDGEVAWAYLVRPPHEIFGLIWLYNCCAKREAEAQSRTGAIVIPGVEPVAQERRIVADEDIECFGLFTNDGLDVEWMIVCVKKRMCALVAQGRQMAYTVHPLGGSNLLTQLPAVVWAKIPQDLKLWAMDQGCELVSFDI